MHRNFYGTVSILVLFLVFSRSENFQISKANVLKFVGKLWKIEHTKFGSTKDYSLNFQGFMNKNNPKADEAPHPLFAEVNVTALISRIRTIPAFMKLLDNYVASVGVPETRTSEHEEEIQSFLSEIMKTDVLKETRKFLEQEGMRFTSEADFLHFFEQLWFAPYKRRRQNDSSAFEHVFVGEKKGSEVSGFHNWIQFLRLERTGVLDYQGYFAKQCGDPPRVATLAFRMQDGSTKPRGSMLLGTSPEFEMALYTVIFLSRHKHFNVQLDSCKAVVTCHPTQGGSYIGTCYIK
ncbi:hypothetical protein CRM22_005406 [Opisthorchis felineus]|uniref:Uridylate-specific endoribonuclease n=1 Tax=Opisthorchis felineus TaxID=147828 RepID=A0A4S2LR99_OPIFE|nr:hypothetical protein CRM22_005406 [Opisthorchis felineus]